MFESAAPLRDEFARLEKEMADPELHGNPAKARKVGRRYAELTPIMAALVENDRLTGDIAAARELAADDASFVDEVTELETLLEANVAKLTRLLAPRDPNDTSDLIMEVKSGEGGEESALFARDLVEMYTRYADTRGWKVEVLDTQDTDMGGYKSCTLAIKGSTSAGPDDQPYGNLKFEGGVHRVQRVPVTETQGRIHTSAAGVLVAPDVEDDEEIAIDDKDLRIDVYRSSGKGGQGVNTTDSAVRITHMPSGIVVTCQNERSQMQNRESAMRVLRARLAQEQADKSEAEAAASRKSQVRTVDRSERIRTYNFPENRLADHRIGFKAYNLDAVLAGDLSAVIAALREADLAERLTHVGE